MNSRDQTNYKIMWATERDRAEDLQRQLDKAKPKDAVNLQKELFAARNRIDELERKMTHQDVQYANLEAFNKRILAQKNRAVRITFLIREIARLDTVIDNSKALRKKYRKELAQLEEQDRADRA